MLYLADAPLRQDALRSREVPILSDFSILCVFVCVFVVITFILDVRHVDAQAGVTQEEGHTGFLHLPSAVLALIFLARRIQPSLALRALDYSEILRV